MSRQPTAALFLLVVAVSFSDAHADIGDELRRLVPDMPVSSQDFGDAIDIAGNIVLVGAEDTPDGAIPSAGAAYLFDVNTGSQLQILTPDVPPAIRAFGSAVALDDTHALIAAEDENNVTGAAYLFDMQGNQLARLTASDGAAGHEFGQAVGISGNIAAVSAPGANTFRGQVYLFDVTTGLQIGDPLAPMPNELLPGDEFGNSLGISGDRLVVGVEDAGLGGAAYIFDTDGNQLHKLLPPIDPQTQNPVRGFGRAVAISGNVALISATPDEIQVFPGEFGRAYLFDVTTGEQLFELVPDDSLGEDLFGEDLDISGNVALISARREAALGTLNQGYLFDVSTGEQVASLNLGPDIIVQDEALEGIAVDGRFAVGGVESYDSPGFSNNGIAIVFDADLGTLSCDFDGNGFCDGDDIDMLVAAIAAGNNPSEFDLDGDGLVDLDDRDSWLTTAGDANIGAPYLLADANLDGFVDGQDFIVWNGSKFMALAEWTSGDFNADGFVDGQDFIIWNMNKFMSSGAAAAVPEPATGMLLVAVGLLAAARRQR